MLFLVRHVLVALLWATAAIAAAPPHSQVHPSLPPVASRVVAAFGDTDVTAAAAANVRLAAGEGSVGFIGLGDYDYGAGAGAWRAQMAPLLGGGCLCVAGNHDRLSAYVRLFPDTRSYWSTSVAGV